MQEPFCIIFFNCSSELNTNNFTKSLTLNNWSEGCAPTESTLSWTLIISLVNSTRFHFFLLNFQNEIRWTFNLIKGGLEN
jgi:hypothetical protein